MTYTSVVTTLIRAKHDLYRPYSEDSVSSGYYSFSKGKVYVTTVPVSSTATLYGVTAIDNNGREAPIGEWWKEFELLNPNAPAQELYSSSEIFSKYYRPIMAKYGLKAHNNPLTPVIVEGGYVPGYPNIAYEISRSNDEANPLYGVTLLEYHPETLTITQHPETGAAYSISEAREKITKLSTNDHDPAP